MTFYNLFTGCKADATALIFRTTVQPLKNIKDTAYVFGVNAYPIVTKAKDPFLLFPFCRHMDVRGSLFVEFNAIADQVLKKLANLNLFCQHNRQRVMGHNCAVLFNLNLEIGSSAFNYIITIGKL